jgi:glucosamine-phosphate N-acetyltransferase
MDPTLAKSLSSTLGPISLRPVQTGDLQRGFFDLLGQLTKAPPLSEDAFAAYVARVDASPDQFVLVAEREGAQHADAPLLGTASVLIEHKAVRGGSCVGHVEDVVVDSTARGASLGRALILRLVELCRELQCYKVILDCTEENASFYERCGFERKEIQMALYF